MYRLKRERIRVPTAYGGMKCVLLRPRDACGPLPGILWIHGGGYVLGMADMVRMSCGKLLAERYGAVVLSPEYRLAGRAPYPAALEDCAAALEYLWDRAEEMGVDRERVIVGGESAGGGLAAALCIYTRDRGRARIAMQIPLYPMIDCEDTESSRDNHGRVWNTGRNHWGWSRYLGSLYGTDRVPPCASAARETDYRDLPPCYTFVCRREPFYRETLDYVQSLRRDGVRAEADVYPGDVHAFDMLCPFGKTGRQAREGLCRVYGAWLGEMGRGQRS